MLTLLILVARQHRGDLGAERHDRPLRSTRCGAARSRPRRSGSTATARADRGVRAVGGDRRPRRRAAGLVHAPRQRRTSTPYFVPELGSGVDRARRHARLAHGRGRDQRRGRASCSSRPSCCRRGSRASVDHVQPWYHMASLPAGLQPILFGLGALTYAKHPEGILEFQKRRSYERIQGLIDRFKAQRAKRDSARPRRAGRRVSSPRPRGADREPARGAGVTEELRGHHRAQRGEPRRRRAASSSASSGPTARARRRSSTACSAC